MKYSNAADDRKCCERPTTVLIIARAAEAKRMAVALDAIEIIVTTEPDQVSAALAHSRFDVIVSDWPWDSHSPAEFVEEVRTACRHHTSVVFFANVAGPEAGGIAFRAGADDFVRRSAGRDEIVARVLKAARLTWLERALECDESRSSNAVSSVVRMDEAGVEGLGLNMFGARQPRRRVC